MRFYRSISFLIAVLFTAVLLVLSPGCGRFNSTDPILGIDRDVSGFAFPMSELSNQGYYVEQTFTDYTENLPRRYHERLWVRDKHQFLAECTGIDELIDGIWTPCPAEKVIFYNDSLRYGSKSYFVAFERGFKIKDPELFLRNYNYSVLHTNEEYLGHSTIIARVTSRQLDCPNYTVWLDKATGFVLRYSEDTPIFDPLYTFEVTHIEFEPDFSGVDFAVWRITEEELSEVGLVQKFGFKIYQPLYLPDGFRPLPPLKRTAIRKDGDITNFIQSFTDGLQDVSISQYVVFENVGTTQVGVLPKSSHKQKATGSPGTNRPLIIGPVGTSLHTVSKSGSRALIFQVGVTFFVIRGKIHDEEMENLIRSLVPIK